MAASFVFRLNPSVRQAQVALSLGRQAESVSTLIGFRHYDGKHLVKTLLKSEEKTHSENARELIGLVRPVNAGKCLLRDVDERLEEVERRVAVEVEELQLVVAYHPSSLRPTPRSNEEADVSGGIRDGSASERIASRA